MCPFCNIQDRVVISTKSSFAVLSNPRLLPGHTLVIPKRHIENPAELSEVELLDIFQLINTIRSRLLEHGAEGCDIRQNYRPFLPEGETKVNHVHFHVLPRTNEDTLYKKSMRFEKSVFKTLSSEEALLYKRLLGSNS